jgi:putative membrane protein
MAELLAAAPLVSRTFGNMDFDGGGWFWMMLMMIIGTAVVVLLIYLLVRAFYHGEFTTTSDVRESPIDIARRRYAAGEITHEQFEGIKSGLED